MTEALAPCPFCDGDADTYKGRHSSSVKCDNGHAIHVYGDTIDAAITAWNTRPPNPLQADVEALWARVAELESFVRVADELCAATNQLVAVCNARTALAIKDGIP